MIIHAFFDGSCGPRNPGGTAKWGFAVKNEEGVIIHTDSGVIGEGPNMTNNVAEYYGLIHCLKYLTANHSEDHINVFGDSKMVVLMTKKIWGRRNPHKHYPHLKPLLYEARELFWELDNCELSWIPREDNQLADYLSKV